MESSQIIAADSFSCDESPPTEIEWAEQLEALAEPTRFAIFSAIAWGGATTIREAGARIGHRPGSLYRHFEQLERVGLLEVTGVVETTRRSARVYRAPTNPRFVYRPEEPALVDALCALVRSAARHAARGVERSAQSGRAVTRGDGRDTMMSSQSGWLTPVELAEINRMADEMRTFLLTRPPREGASQVELTVFLSPAPGAPEAETDD